MVDLVVVDFLMGQKISCIVKIGENLGRLGEKRELNSEAPEVELENSARAFLMSIPVES